MILLYLGLANYFGNGKVSGSSAPGATATCLMLGLGAFEEIGLVGEGSPEVVDEVGVSGGADVVEDGLDAGVGGDFGVGPEFYGGHVEPFRLERINVATCSEYQDVVHPIPSVE